MNEKKIIQRPQTLAPLDGRGMGIGVGVGVGMGGGGGRVLGRWEMAIVSTLDSR
jgi:hypothetical protein